MNFAVIGVGGYVARRHLQAIKDTGNRVVLALDPSDSVGILDSYFPDCEFFTEFERFDRKAEKLRRNGSPIHYVSICSPNYLHDAHCRFALRIGADAICEKPIVLNPWNIRALREMERETNHRIFAVLQLRLHPTIKALRDRIQREPEVQHEVIVDYCTPRGKWYASSWKSDVEKSGGLPTNIGVHLFDMLLWIFGGERMPGESHVDPTDASGKLYLSRADVIWHLSINRERPPTRVLSIDGKKYDFTTGFEDLHTEVYKDVLSGGGFSLEDALPAIELCYRMRR